MTMGIRMWLAICILGVIISLFSTMPTLIKQQQTYVTGAQILMCRAQKNGGFSDEMINQYAELLSRSALSISEINFTTYPSAGEPVQKREVLWVELTPIYKGKGFLGIHFSYKGEPMRIERFSHQYEKE